MPPVPATKRTVVFVDGQNLFHAVRETFGRPVPDYDVEALARHVCAAQGWSLLQIRFYTGVPAHHENERWHRFWTAKLEAMEARGILTFGRRLHARSQIVDLPDGSRQTVGVTVEKGIDVRIALDTIRLAYRQEYDVALIFSQDQDLVEVAEEIRSVAREQNRWIKIACGFPFDPQARNRKGIDKTDWIRIDQDTYESCLDPVDYFRPGVPSRPEEPARPPAGDPEPDRSDPSSRL